jgi:thiol:disulfide interchange protein
MFSKLFLPLPFLLTLFIVISNGYINPANAEEPKHVSIRLLPEKTDVAGGETITVGIEQTIDPHWHTYWINPGDSGTAARIQWTGADVSAAPITWPAPKKLTMGPLTNFGYEEKVILLQDLTMPEKLSGSAQVVRANIDILVCNEICIPESHAVSFTINGDQAPSPATVEMARAAIPLDMGWSTTIGEDGENLVVRIETDTPSAFSKLGSIELYPEEWGLVINGAKADATKEGSTLTLRQKRDARALSDVPVSKLVVTYEDASGVRKAVRVSTIADGAAPDQNVMPHETTFLQAVFFALLGGLILNLMPCVFPVLSMKALSLVQLKDQDNAKARLHGLAYTAGILVCFAAIAGILIALKAGGAQVGWGFQLQHPGIILFLAYLFFTLGLNLIGLFDFSFSLAHAGDSLTRKKGLSGSFFTGVLATLVATPCTAPFMAGAMGYAITQSAAIAMAIFLALGFGLALPYLALTFIPALRHTLPRPGLWMERFRQFLAFPMFAGACWLLWVLSQQIDHMGQFAALLGMLAIAFGLWLWRYKPKHHGGRFVFIAATIASFAFVAYTFFAIKPVDTSGQNVESKIEKGQNWEDFSRVKLEDYLKGNEPVFVNMTAAWCITCKVNEKVALAVDATEKLFVDHKVRYLKGDWTNQNPEITTFLEEYGRSGVPIYVYYGPRDATGARPEPVVLPQILTPGIVEKAIKP